MGWYDMFKDALSMAQKADNIDLVRQLLDMQKELQDLQQCNLDLTKENASLREELEKRALMTYDDDNNYYMVKEKDGTLTGRYCPKCWDKERKQSRLAKFNLDLRCNVCGTVVGDKNIEQAKKEADDYNFFV